MSDKFYIDEFICCINHMRLMRQFVNVLTDLRKSLNEGSKSSDIFDMAVMSARVAAVVIDDFQTESLAAMEHISTISVKSPDCSEQLLKMIDIIVEDIEEAKDELLKILESVRPPAINVAVQPANKSAVN